MRRIQGWVVMLDSTTCSRGRFCYTQNIPHMKAWQLIEDPKHWTTDAYARNSNGHVTDPSSPGATRWCTIGACMKLYTFDEYHIVYTRLRLTLNGLSIGSWNDDTDHATVLAKLKELDI